MKKTLAEIIIENREKNKMSQRELARKINLNNAYLSRIENGEIKQPSVNIIMKISNELKLDTLELLFMTYSKEEIEIMGVLGNNINDVYHFVSEEELKNISITDKNENIRISIIKMLDQYKKGNIDERIVLGILSTITNKNFYNYLTEEELKKIKNSNEFTDKY